MISPGVAWSGVSIAWRGRQVVHDLDFAIDLAAWNHRVPIIGPSGCGKSTLLYGVSGMMELNAGKVDWQLPNGGEASWGATSSAGESELRARLRHRRFAFAFQDSALLPHLTVHDNLRYPIDIAMEKSDLAIDDVREHVCAVLSAVLVGREKVDEVLGKNPRQLSGGQRRRVAIAQAMMTMPDVLFLDEPAGGLDPDTKASVMEKIDAWVDAASPGSRAVFWVTHHIDMAEFQRCSSILEFRHQPNRDDQSSDEADRDFTVRRSTPAEVLSRTPGQ